jgi:tetratricopeptide (TPR) repeat protein
MIRQTLSTTLIVSLLSLAAFAGAGHDRATLNKARALYGKGDYAAAVKKYSEIKQDSDYFATAVEERAHTHGKAGEYNKALGDLTTLFSPVFEKTTGPEAYFTGALTHFRLCQYKQVIETMAKFKTNMRERVVALSALSEGVASPALAEAASALRTNYSSLSYAKNAHLLPNLFHLDKAAKAAIKSGNNMALTRAVAKMANEDLKEIAANTKKLHLVEAEIMQRLNLAESRKDNDRNRMGKFKRDDGQLVFPYNGEVWIDELDAYQVQAENCPKGKGV